MNTFYMINPNAATDACKRLGLAAFGCAASIFGLAYTHNKFLSAADDASSADELQCSIEEWKEVKQRLLDDGAIIVVDGLIVPAAQWAKPELDA